MTWSAQFALSEAKARFDALGDRRGQSPVLYTLTFMYLGQERWRRLGSLLVSICV